MELLDSSPMHDELLKRQLLNYTGTDIRVLGAKNFIEKEHGISKLKTFLQFDGITQQKGTNNTKTQAPFYYKIAASLLLIITLSVGGFYMLKPTNYYQLYAIKDTGLNLFMGENASNLDELMTEYKDGDFEKAKKTGINLIVQQPTNDTLHYYLAVINCELKLPNDAISEFNLVSTKSAILFEKAFFAKALCLMNINKAIAKSSLLEIAENPNNTYYNQAKLVLSKEY